jgi:hypothetical protein
MLMAAVAILGSLLLPPKAPLEAPQGAPRGLEEQLRRVSQAFRASDSSRLRSTLPPNGRIDVDFRGGPQGSYARGQLEVILRRIFHDFPTSDLEFRERDVTVNVAGTAYARGRWSRRARAGGAELADFLTLVLREESGDWRIFEIRSSR